MEYNKSYINAKLQQVAKKFGMSRGVKSAQSPTSNRLPPGQYETKQFPVLDLGVRPELTLQDFTLRLNGEVKNPQVVKSAQFLALPTIKIKRDFHCVTRWSRYDLEWEGVPLKTIMDLVQPKEHVRYILAFGRDGYSTNLPIEECLKSDVILAYKLEGQEIPLIHGGPVRLIIPHLYGWKSAKFVDGIKFLNGETLGFWETRGYHVLGDPWLEQRYS